MNVPHFEQELDYSCLPASVRMVLAFYDYENTEAELRVLLRTRPGGYQSRSTHVAIVPELGFEAYVQSGSRPILRETLAAGRPCVVHVWTQLLPHWQEETIHALVVTELTEEGVLAHDPVLPAGPTAIPLNAFLQAWAATDYLTIVIQPAEKISE